jgi:hypothetical protein
MKESTRRTVLFAIIVITGSVMILFDVPLIIMIPLVIAVGFIILFVLGAITVEDIKSSLAHMKQTVPAKTAGTQKPASTSKPAETPSTGSILGRLKNFRLPIGKAGGSNPTAPSKPEKKGTAKIPEKTGGIRGHINSFISSVKSIGTVLQAKNKTQRKVADINKQLDKTVSEKVVKETSTAAPVPSAGGAGSAAASSAEADPFLSLSDDEFDPGLLDGLDDQELGSPAPGSESAPVPDLAAGSDLPDPASDIDAASAAILKSQDDGSLDEFGGLDPGSGGDALDSEFGDLENINLDDVEMDVDLDGELGDAGEPSEPESAPAAAPVSPQQPNADESTVKTAWIPSDAPKGMDQVEDQISTQSDMASFASGPGSDEDMLSSLAADVKHIEKKVDISLVRELKDFKAPAQEIENELDEVFKKISSVKNSQAKKTETLPNNGMK